MKRSYHTIDKQGKVGERKLTEFLVHNGQALLSMLKLIEQSRMAIDELIDVIQLLPLKAQNAVITQIVRLCSSISLHCRGAATDLLL